MMWPRNLRCEYLFNPVGIDVRNPRLSWNLEESGGRIYGLKQTAYRIIVAGSQELLDGNEGDIWDTGQVFSGSSVQIEYSGKPLRSRQLCWWKVRVWDNKGSSPVWSEKAFWSMGLLNQADRQARWIGFDAALMEYRSKQLYGFTSGAEKWIWHSVFPDVPASVKGEFYFRRTFRIEHPDDIDSATCLITADEAFVLFVNGVEAAVSDRYIFSWTRPHLIDISRLTRRGENVIAVRAGNSYLSKPGLAAKIDIQFRNGGSVVFVTDAAWKSSTQSESGWNEIGFDESRWPDAREVAIMGDMPWRVPHYELVLPPPPYLRKKFQVNYEVKSAFLYASALGLYDVYLNGKKVTEDRLSPGWSDYVKRVYYRTYEVTHLLEGGRSNVLGAILADGWYSGYIGWERKRGYYGDHPRLWLQLEVEYRDGSRETVITDGSWKASHGPLREADLLMGETYDARQESAISGWLADAFDDSSWQPVSIEPFESRLMTAYPGNPVRGVDEIRTQRITEPRKGIFIFDMGQNFAGVVRLSVRAAEGTRVTLRYGEMLNADGTLYTENIRMARATDTYITKGKGTEIREPFFTYHGFRYVEMTGFSGIPDTDMLTGVVIHSALPPAGEFRCSDELVNKIHSCIRWSQRSNFVDIPTDCPQRDERLGWTDNHHFFPTAAFNMDIAAFYTKWLIDLNDAQEESGAYPAIAPNPGFGVGPVYSGEAAFADSGVCIPYDMYRHYGDVEILRRYYGDMKRYASYLERNSDDGIRHEQQYGDWLSVDADTPRGVIATSYFGRVIRRMSEIAFVLGKTEDAGYFERLFGKIKTAFNKLFVDADGRIEGDTQTAYVLAIHFELLDEHVRVKAFSHLIRNIEARDYHLSTGFFGVPFLLPVLSVCGRPDLAYKLLLNDTYPSWGFMVRNGATTVWERWNSYSPEKGMFDPLMNSFNHFSLGAFGYWLYAFAAGIRQRDNGLNGLCIQPYFTDRLRYVYAEYRSMNGYISCRWERNTNGLVVEISVPVNMIAEVCLPENARRLIPENGDETHASGDGHRIFELGSGKYRFAIDQ